MIDPEALIIPGAFILIGIGCIWISNNPGLSIDDIEALNLTGYGGLMSGTLWLVVNSFDNKKRK